MSKIEWTERSDWNPIRGCTRVSPGCGGPGDAGGCYAEAMAARFSDAGQWGHGYATRTAKGGRWTGMVAVQWDRLTLPIRWRKPALIFASSTSDFFHEALDMGDIARLFGVMIVAHHLRGHRFQVLTKRAERMRLMLDDAEFWEIAAAEARMHVMEHVDPLDRRRDDARATCRDDYGPGNPAPGIWLGVSVENQAAADERIPALLATPAALRFLSCEPLLGPVDIRRFTSECYECGLTCGLRLPGPPSEERCVECGEECDENTMPVCSDGCPKCGGELEYLCPDCGHYMVYQHPDTPVIDWVICGGESGPKARPMHPDWARGLRDQCAGGGVPFFFKQWGEWLPDFEESPDRPDDDPEQSRFQTCVWDADEESFDETNGTWCDADQWFIADNYREPEQPMTRVGKRRAGRLLDGVLHDAMPGVSTSLDMSGG